MKRFIFVSTIALFLVGCGSTAQEYDEYEIVEGNNYQYEEIVEEIAEELLEEIEEVEEVIEENEEIDEEMPEEPYLTMQTAVALSTASGHTLALMEDDTLWSWGVPGGHWGHWEQEEWSVPVQIMDNVTFAVAGHDHSFAITNDGALWGWGINWHGQLGDGTTEHRPEPVHIMDDVIHIAMPNTVPNSHADAGNGRSYAIRSDGTLWAWGANGHVDAFSVILGDGTEEPRHYPVQIMENVAAVHPTERGGYALTNDGRLWHWHSLIWYSILVDDEWVRNEIEPQLYPVPIMENVASISRGLVITRDGQLWQLGADQRGWMMGGEPIWIMDNVVYATTYGGANFAITTDGTLMAWGDNRLPTQWGPRPMLGDGTTIDRPEPVVIMENIAYVTAVGNNAYAIGIDGALWHWGMGTISSVYWLDGSEWYGSHRWEYAFDERGFPSGKRWLLDDDDDTGIRFSPVKVLENVTQVAATYFMLDHGWARGTRAFALTNDGAVYAWGVNNIGFVSPYLSLLGDGTTETRPYPVRIISGRQR